MAEHSRIDELKRRLQQDPTSLAFAQLAEALRRSGRIDEAIETCRSGLAHHPTYVSAHVTLGRALIEHGDLDAAQAELSSVLAEAPENLAAIRGLADIHQRRGEQFEALAQYRRALTLAPNDPELEETVSRIASGLGDVGAQPPATAAGMPAAASGEPSAVEPPLDATPAVPDDEPQPAEPTIDQALDRPLSDAAPADPLAGWLPAETGVDEPPAEPVVDESPAGPLVDGASLERLAGDAGVETASVNTPEPGPDSALAESSPAEAVSPEPAADQAPAARQVEALERWLDAILADRERPRA